MKIRWLLEGNKEEIGKALKEWKENFDNTMLELSKKSVETPFGKFPVPIFTVNYEEVDKGYIYEVNLPFEKIPKIVIWGNFSSFFSLFSNFFISSLESLISFFSINIILIFKYLIFFKSNYKDFSNTLRSNMMNIPTIM